jgi:ATP-dependent helicase/nuclease subunit A
VGVLRRVGTHPIFAAAASALKDGRCYRETPVTLHLESGELVEGFVDLAFEADGEMIVVDFKTDRELEGSLEVYRRQVEIYARAISAATGRPARGVLMKI